MIKRSKAVYIIGSAIIGMLSVLAIYFALIGVDAVNISVKKLTLTSASAAREYDGTPLTANEFKITGGELSSGHTVKATFSGEQTKAGVGQNFFSVTIVDENGVDCTEDYNVTYQFGNLTVNKRELTLVTEGGSKVYDGVPLTKNEYRILSGSLVDGDVLDVTYTAEAVKVGETLNGLTAVVTDLSGAVVTENYAISVDAGLLTVTPIKLTIRTDSVTKVYDGTPVSVENYSITDGSLLEGHCLVAENYSELTEIGTADNKADFKAVNEAGEDVSENYDFDVVCGELEVTPIVLIIESGSSEKEYDGNPLTSDFYSFNNPEALLEGHRLESVTVNGSQTVIGGDKNNNTLIFKVFDKDDIDVSDYYTFDVEKLGTLVVSKIKLTVRVNDTLPQYDGLEHASAESGYVVYETSKAKLLKTVAEDGSETVDELVIDKNSYVPAKGIEIGSYDAAYSWKVMRGDREVTAFYDVEFVGGLVIQKRPVYKVQLANLTDSYGKTKILKGRAETDGNGNIICSGLLEGHYLTYVSLQNAVLDHVGTQSYTVVTAAIDEDGNQSFIVKDADGNDVTRYYTLLLSETQGQLTLTADETTDNDKNRKVLEFTTDTPAVTLLKRNDWANNVRGVSWDNGGLSGFTYDSETYSDAELKELELKLSLNRINSTAVSNGTVKFANEADLLSYGAVYPYYLSGVTDAGNPYSFTYLPFNYFGGAKNNYASAGDAATELNYRKYAYANYLTVTESTKAELKKLIAEKGFAYFDGSTYSESEINKVVNYLKNAITYNLKGDYTALDSDENLAVTLLCRNKKLEGVCRHYASAGVMLFRTLGYPARYVTGYCAVAKTAGKPVEVTASDGHAWVEIYIDGFGWYPLDVTGSSGDSGDSSGDSGGAVTDNVSVKVRLKNKYVMYDGSSHGYFDGYALDEGGYYVYDGTNENVLSGFDEFVKKGYAYKIKVSAANVTEGKINASIEDFMLLNAKGERVKPMSEELHGGVLQVYKCVITVKTGSESKTYDGTPLKPSAGAAYKYDFVCDGYDETADEVTVTLVNEITGVGSITNEAKIVVTRNGKDVTEFYKINYNFGTLKVDSVKITVTVGSKTLSYEEWMASGGGKVVEQSASVTEGGELLEALGHTVTFVYDDCYVDEEGCESVNRIKYCVITDKDNNDVTGNYSITTVNGLLFIDYEE